MRDDTRARVEDIRYRKFALKQILAFKTLTKSHWEYVLKGV